jgi:putative hydrolase of the HAD superfamily
VLDELERLKGRFPIYAFTNTNPTHEQEWQRRYSDELSVFSKIYVSSNIQMRKPNIEAYEYVCKDMGVAASEVLFFDDLHENIVGANNAGLQTQLVDHESTTVSRLKQFK